MRYIKILGILSVFLVLFSLISVPAVFAQGTLSASNTDETVTNQAMAAGQELLIFDGSLTSTGDSAVFVDTFQFSFNEDIPNDVIPADPENQIDSLVVRFPTAPGASDTLDVDDSTTGPIYDADINLTLGGGVGPVPYTVSLISRTSADNDAKFDLAFQSIQYVGDPGGENNAKIINSISGSPSQLITIKSLVESYAAVDGERIPRILASESGDIPLIHMEFAGANTSEDRSLAFSQIRFRIRELLGDVIPGGDSKLDDYGDFGSVKLIRSNREQYGAGDEETLFTIGRVELPSDPGDSYIIDFSQDVSTEDGNDAWPPDSDDEFVEETLTQTTERSHYFVTIATNDGWGTSPADGPNAQNFGYGDAWDAVVDTGGIVLTNGVTNTDIGDTFGSVSNGPIYNSLKNLTGFERKVDKFGGDPVKKLNDREGLDYLPDPLFEFVALGAADSGTRNTTLDAITITFPKTSSEFTPKDDFRELSDDKKSGLSIWHNRSAFKSFGHGEDDQLGLSADSNWKSDTIVELVIQNGFTLPTPSESISNPDKDLEVNRGMLFENVNRTLYVSGILRQTGDHPDSFVARIPPGGLKFSQGNSVADTQSTRLNPQLQPKPAEANIPVHFDTGAFNAQSVTVFFDKLTADSQEIGAPSDPTAVIGLNAVDHADQGGTQAILNRLDLSFESADGSADTAFTQDDLNPLANLDTSGVSIFMDNDDHPRNINGEFQPNIDHRIPLDLDDSTKNAPTGKGEDFPHIRLFVDHTSTPVPVVPPSDSSDTEVGNDFFVVVTTSDKADNLDDFKTAIGSQAINDGIKYQLGFNSATNPDTEDVTTIFAKGDSAETDRFFADLIEINTITALNINPLVAPNTKIGIGGRPVELFGLDISDGERGDQTLEGVEVRFNFTSNSDTSDIDELAETDESGVALWADNGDGEFDRRDDEFIPINNPSWKTYSSTATVNLDPRTSQEIPNLDPNDGLDEFYVTVTASNSIELGDSFSATIEGGAINFSVEDSSLSKSATTDTITATLPILTNNRTESPREIIRSFDATEDVLGINISDEGTGEKLEKLTVRVENIGDNDFQKSDLQALSSDTTSGVGIWKDSNNNDQLDPATDEFLVPQNTLSFNNDLIDFNFVGSSSDTEIPNNLDNSDDFFVVIKVSTTIDHSDNFEVGLPDNAVETTRFQGGLSVTSNPIVFGSANGFVPTISDTDLMNNNLSVKVTVPNQDTVALRLARDEAAVDTPLSHLSFEVIETKGSDGDVYSFDDLNVSISVDTIALAARAFNDTGPSDFSATEVFSRNELVGIDLTGAGRPAGADLSSADAMAADEKFGIAVFGDKGGSNDNSDDPVFNPARGETLKIIPPVDSTVTIEIYNLQQERVFKTSTSIPGAPAEWDGSGQYVSTVNNGVYIVKVKSGSEVKSFPVVVLK